MKPPKFIFQAEENLVEKDWGGYWISKLKGLPSSRKVGESWEFSAHPSKPSKVLLGKSVFSFQDVFSLMRREILGTLSEKYSYFPILVKLLDVNDKISVQVHPSDEVAKLLGEEDPGKSEGWIILKEGKVYAGFKEDVDPEEIRKNPEKTLTKLNEFKAKFLDTFKINAGTVHFAEETRFLEISTNSNITYRIFDFKGREVQLEKAIKAMNTSKSNENDIKGEKGWLEMERFAAETIEVKGQIELNTNKTFNLIFCLDGKIKLESEGETSELKKGYSCLIPAATKKYTIEGKQAKIIKIHAK